MPPKTKKPAPFELAPPVPALVPAARHPRLPLDGSRGVRLTLEGADFAALEAAAAELKARFGARFAVTDRHAGRDRSVLRISATLLVRGDDALDAGTGSEEAWEAGQEEASVGHTGR